MTNVPTGTTVPKLRGKGTLITGTVLLVLGLAVIVVSIVMTAGAATSLVTQIGAAQTAPTTLNSQLNGGTTYAVYEVAQGGAATVQPADITVTGPSGPVPVANSNATVTANGQGNQNFTEVATFTPPSTGSYAVAVATKGALVAVAPALSTAAKGVAWIAAIIPGVLFALIGVILLIVGAVQRSSSRKRQQTVANPTV
jgi:hypothetical protein